MNPESPILAELQPLLDAVCEESITPGQLARMEELVLAHPEAEQHYIRFMSFHADLIGTIAGLPEWTVPSQSSRHTPSAVDHDPRSVPATAADGTRSVPATLPSNSATYPSTRHDEIVRADRPRSRYRKLLSYAGPALLILLICGSVAAYQLISWSNTSRDLADSQLALEASRLELVKAQAERDAAQRGNLNELNAAMAAERKLAGEYQTALRDAIKAVAEKEFVVKVTGPEHFEPGAPNKWQIETFRHSGSAARPKQMEIVVKDEKDTTLFRQSQRDSVGATTLELPASFWTKVKTGTNLFLEVSATMNDRPLQALADRIPLARPVYVTHLVTDKPLYQPGEIIRFRSLTLDRSTLRPPSRDMHLRFRIRVPGDAVIPLDEGNGRLMVDLEPVLGSDKLPLRGIGVGEYQLSADAPGGEYKLELLEVDTSKSKEVLLETRKFIVNRYVPDTFEKKLEFDGKSYGAGDVVQARIEVSRTAGGPMKDARANVAATLEGREFHTEKDQRFTIVTEPSGTKAVLNVRFKLPADLFNQKSSPSATLSVNIQDGSDTEAIVRPIPLVTKTLVVDFFPEGGEMIEGLAGRVYFQVRTPQGKPADLKGIITDGTATVAEVATLTDAENAGVNRGHGVFTLMPRPGAKYFLKLQSPIGISEPTKDGYPLPVAKDDGIALTALDAVTPRGAPVRIRIQTNEGRKNLHVGAYARGRLISQERVEVEAGKPVEVSLPGDPAAGGVTRVTVFQELRGEGLVPVLAPRAERLVYRVPGEQLVLGVKPDRKQYTPGDKVRLELSAANERDQPTPAVLLVGVVNRSVITMADNKTDRLLPTHFLLSGEVSHPSELEHADFLLTDHPKAGIALDLLLATQGWRRFAEQNGTALDLADKKEVDQMLISHGQATSAPIELRKLEEQRVTSEYRAKMESAVLKTADAESRLLTFTRSLTAAVDVAKHAYETADGQYGRLLSEESRSESQFFTTLPILLFLVIVAPLFIGFLSLVVKRRLGSGNTGTPSESFISRNLGYGLVGILFLILGIAVISYSTLEVKHKLSYVTTEARPDDEQPLRNPAKSKKPQSPQRPPRQKRDSLDGSAGSDVDFTQQSAQDDKANRPQNTSVSSASVAPQGPVVSGPSPASPGGGRGGGQFWGSERRSKLPPYQPQGQWREQSDQNRMFEQPAIAGGKPVGNLDANAMKKFAKNLQKQNSSKNMGGELLFPPDYDIALIDPELLQVPPFFVREYAHERDPALGNVRSDFTETVYWHPVLVLPRTGKASIEFQFSDDIARYEVLVAGHTVDGRIGAITTTIEARKPFSVDPKLPLQISHTDRIDVPIRVTNDSDVRRDISVALTQTTNFSADKLEDTIPLGPNGKDRRIFQLRPNKLEGIASLTVEATSKPGSDKDTIARKIHVVPDGFPGVGSLSDLLEGRYRGILALPKDMVPGSLAVRLEVYPTTMSDLVKGLDGLLREPSGCFEQTSTTNYPNVMILEYLNQTNQADPQAAQRAKQLLDRGLGRLTSFECPDTPLKLKHGFEWFGAADMAHEALTAYGLLQFKDMSRVHPVDPKLIKRTQEFLLSRKDGTGGFLLNTHGHHQFGQAPKYTNDAYIVWALVESDPDDAEKLDLKKEIEGLKTLAMKEDSAAGKDAYFLALTANIMLLRGDRETGFRLLDRLQKKHMKAGAITGAVTSITRSGGRDLDIETTALTLLGWLRANDPTYTSAIKEATKWISQQRGGYGGFGSTQSTILTLKALSLYAKKSAHPAESGEITITAGGKPAGARKFTDKDVEVIALNIENPEALFKPGEKTVVDIATDARQPYPFSLSYTYTMLTPPSAEECAVKIATKLARTEANEGDTVPLSVTIENRQKQGHGMAVAIVGLPAGLKVPTDLKQLTDLREKQQVSFFEIRGRELILYWRELIPEQKTVLTIDLVCDVPGIYRGPASRGYLYYNADHKHWVEPLSISIKPMAEK